MKILPAYAMHLYYTQRHVGSPSDTYVTPDKLPPNLVQVITMETQSVEVLMEKKTLRRYGHAVRMDLERKPKLVLEARPE
jgi:hypothetical protein